MRLPTVCITDAFSPPVSRLAWRIQTPQPGPSGESPIAAIPWRPEQFELLEPTLRRRIKLWEPISLRALARPGRTGGIWCTVRFGATVRIPSPAIIVTPITSGMRTRTPRSLEPSGLGSFAEWEWRINGRPSASHLRPFALRRFVADSESFENRGAVEGGGDWRPFRHRLFRCREFSAVEANRMESRRTADEPVHDILDQLLKSPDRQLFFGKDPRFSGYPL